MDLKKLQHESSPDDDVEESGSSSSEENSSAEESGSSDDDFDSSDDRVNQIPSQGTHPEKSSSYEDASSESDSESESSGTKQPPLIADSIGKSIGVRISQRDDESGSVFKDSSPGTVLSRHSKANEKETKSRKIRMEEDTSKNKVEDVHSLKKNKVEVSKMEVKDLRSNGLQNGQCSTSKNQRDHVQTTHKDGQIPDQNMKKAKDSIVASVGKSVSLVRNRDVDSGDKEHSVKRRKESNTSEVERLNNLLDENNKVAKEVSRKTEDNGLIPEKRTSITDSEVKQGKANNHVVKEHSFPMKQSKPHVWSSNEEVVLASEILNHVKLGMEIPNKKNDEFWVKLSEMVKEKLGLEASNDQLNQRVKRMKQRYQIMAQKVKACKNLEEAYKYKNDSKQHLFNIWTQIWGKEESTVENREDAEGRVREHVIVKNAQKDCNTKESDVKNAPSGLQSDKTVAKEAKVSTITPNLGNCSSPNMCSLDALAIEKLVQDETLAGVNLLRNWISENMEDWINRVRMLVGLSINIPGNRSMQISGMGMGEFLLNTDIMSFEPFSEDQDLCLQLYNLQSQKLDLEMRKLQILQEECDLKRKLLKLRLQHKRSNQK